MDISESVQRIVSNDGLVTDLFYIKYLDRYPELRKYFEGVEMQHQSVLLKMALSVIQQYYEHRFPGAEQYLRVLGSKHQLRGIPAGLYADWRECMLETLAQFHGHDWSPPLQEEWTAAINVASDVMMSAYGGKSASIRTERLGKP